MGGPTKPLATFPSKRWGAEKIFYRAAGCSGSGHWRSPWWFCACMDCRFDLEGRDGYGTLYAATSPVAAMVEYLGVNLGLTVTPGMLERRVYSLHYDKGFNLANVSDSGGAGYGAQRELTGAADYGVPQQWAQAIHDVPGDGFDGRRFEGIYYHSRYNLDDDEYALAIFHWKGAHRWPVVEWVSGTDGAIVRGLAQRGVTVAEPPLADDLELIQ